MYSHGEKAGYLDHVVHPTLRRALELTCLVRAPPALARAHGREFELKGPGRLLDDFVEFMDRARSEHVSSELALMWATSVSAHAYRWRRRLGVVRGFARYLSTIDPETEVPSVSCERVSRASPRTSIRMRRSQR